MRTWLDFLEQTTMRWRIFASGACGALLLPSFFVPSLFSHLLALLAIAPALALIAPLTWWPRYLAGLCFFGAWILPTTTWYYRIFPWWLALLASVGYVTLIALAFALPALFRRRLVIRDLAFTVIPWALLESVRLYAPVTQDWWIPHLANTQWLNPLIVRAATWGGIPTVIVVVLLVSATLAWLAMRPRRHMAIMGVGFVLGACALYAAAMRTWDFDTPYRVLVVGVQAPPHGGIRANADASDVQELMRMTADAVQSLKYTGQVLFVVWPENMIAESESVRIGEFARAQGIFLVWNRAESVPGAPDRPANTAVYSGADAPNAAVQVLAWKRHAAPSEQITTGAFSSPLQIVGHRVVGAICYDLHYPDIGERLRGHHLVLGMIDDDRYGTLLPYLHASDVVYRAAQHRIPIATGSTSGPTMAVDRFGVVRAGPLPIGVRGVMASELAW
ncbi:hypothetical protein HYV74_00620 [Candidatus Uhrbacteria bacterium]|nr:hypothetical protein [Candidatus Uhrbacteria bacterium]